MLPLREVQEYAGSVASAMQQGRSGLVDHNGRPLIDPHEREQLAYSGARQSRRTGGWRTASTSANAEILSGMRLLLDRSRELIRNNPHASKCLRVFRSHAVGVGIKPKSKNKRAISLWNAHSPDLDADGHSDAQGIISLAAGAVFESGACLIRKRPRRAEDGLRLPFQAQVLEPDYLDFGKNETLRNGGRIFMGIEIDAIGRRVAYWLFSEHPGEMNASVRARLQSRRVPASEVIHCFERWRPGQMHGVPWLAPSMLAMRQTDDWVDADLMRKTVEACIVGVVTRPSAVSGIGQFGPRQTQESDRPDLETFEPGTWAYARAGEDVDFNDPRGITDSKFLDERQHAIAAGAGVPYEEMTGNLSQTNFSSYRAGRLSFWAMVAEFQHLTLIPKVCRGLWRWEMDDAVVVGELSEGEDTTAQWVPPKFPTVNAQQDLMGELLNLRMGGQTWAQFATGQGNDPDEQLEEIADWNRRFDEAGVVLEGDARKVTRAGAVQNIDPTQMAAPGAGE